MDRMVDICLHGAAQGAWNEMTRRAVAGREERWLLKSTSVVISVTLDMAAGVGELLAVEDLEVDARGILQRE